METHSLDMDQIDLPDNMLRTELDTMELDQLAASIAQVGLLQPIVVERKDDRYLLCAGFRRLSAHKLLGKKRIDARILPEGYAFTFIASLIENIQHARLPKLDEARAVRQLVENDGLGIAETSRKLGKTQSWVRGRLDLLFLPEEMAGFVNEGKMSVAVANELARIPDESIRDSYARHAAESGCTANEAQRWRNQVERDIEAGLMPATDPNIERERTEAYQNLIVCDSCEAKFDGIHVRIFRMCPDCHGALMRAGGKP